MMRSDQFVAGPVHVDGHTLNFFVDLQSPTAGEELLAATYTAVFLREHRDALVFDAYSERRTRMSEDDWYGVAQQRYDLHLTAMRAEPDTLRTMREVVEQTYFGAKVPSDIYPLLTQAAVQAHQAQQGVRYAA
jgi:hypothetical protein